MAEEHFTPEGIKALEKMAMEGSVKASDALSKLIGQKISVSAVSVRSVPINKLTDLMPNTADQVVAVTMGLGGDVNGQIILVYPRQSALNVAAFLAKRPLGQEKEIDKLDKSAISESGNIIAGAFLAAISNYLDINMVESTPLLSTDSLEAVISATVSNFIDSKSVEAIAMEINFDMLTPASKEAVKIEPSIATKGYFIMLLNLESAKKVMGSLKDISGCQQMTK
jgi:chemotaxis protein CheC